MDTKTQRDLLMKGVRWICANDELTDQSVESISAAISVLLLADLCEVDPRYVAELVAREVPQIRS